MRFTKTPAAAATLAAQQRNVVCPMSKTLDPVGHANSSISSRAVCPMGSQDRRAFASEASAARPVETPTLQGKAPPSPALPPGWAGKLFGHAAFYKKDPNSRQSPFYHLSRRRIDWYKECKSKIVQLNMAGSTVVYCSDPAVYREVLGEKQTSFTNSNGFRAVFGFLFPKSMIVLEGEDWQRVRRIGQRAINRMSLDAAVGACAEVIDLGNQHNAFGNGSGEEDIDTFKFLNHMTFDVFHKVMYGMDPRTITSDPKNPSVELLVRCEALLSAINGRVYARNYQFLWKLPTKANLELEANRKYIIDVGMKFAEGRREILKNHENTGQTKTLIDALLLSQQEDVMSDREVQDQIATFFFGAYETTSNTLLFTLNSLADNQRVQTKLRQEILKRFPNGKEDIVKATLSELDEVTYLLWTLDESFRLNSTAEAFGRDAIKDVVVGGYSLKKNTCVVIDHSVVARDPTLFPGQSDLDDFNPDRFENFTVDKLSSMPFGFGSRICPGRKIAIAEMKVIIALLLSEYEMLPAKDPKKRLVYDLKLGLTCVEGTGFLRFKRLSKSAAI